jgi:hypothetical protein
VWRIDFQLGWNVDPGDEKKPANDVAYRCVDAKKTVEWYAKYLKMNFVPATAEEPSTKAASSSRGDCTNPRTAARVHALRRIVHQVRTRCCGRGFTLL